MSWPVWARQRPHIQARQPPCSPVSPSLRCWLGVVRALCAAGRVGEASDALHGLHLLGTPSPRPPQHTHAPPPAAVTLADLWAPVVRAAAAADDADLCFRLLQMLRDRAAAGDDVSDADDAADAAQYVEGSSARAHARARVLAGAGGAEEVRVRGPADAATPATPGPATATTAAAIAPPSSARPTAALWAPVLALATARDRRRRQRRAPAALPPAGACEDPLAVVDLMRRLDGVAPYEAMLHPLLRHYAGTLKRRFCAVVDAKEGKSQSCPPCMSLPITPTRAVQHTNTRYPFPRPSPPPTADADEPGNVVQTLRLMLAAPGAAAPPSTATSPAAWRAERLAAWVGDIEGMRRLDLVLEALEE